MAGSRSSWSTSDEGSSNSREGDYSAAEEKTEFTISIKSIGDKKLQVIKAVREIVSGLGLKEAKQLVESNGVVREDVSQDEADEIKAKLEAAGAEVDLS